MHTIKISLARGKAPVVAVHGVAGTSCTSVTQGIEQALGEVESDEKTAEYYEEAVTTHETGASENYHFA